MLVPEGQQEKQNVIFAVRGKLISPYAINISEPFTISIGTLSTSHILTASELANGIDLTRFINIVWNNETVSFPLQIHFSNNTLLVSAVVRDASDRILVNIIDNEWKSESPDSMLIWDRNYNAYAFEVIDRDKIPVLQILMRENNSILIGLSLFAQGIPISLE